MSGCCHRQTAQAGISASVTYDPASTRFALTCPRGDVIACRSTAGDYAGLIDLPKGIAFGMGQGFASNESGEVYRLDLARLGASLQAKLPGMQWDNHLYLTSASL